MQRKNLNAAWLHRNLNPSLCPIGATSTAQHARRCQHRGNLRPAADVGRSDPQYCARRQRLPDAEGWDEHRRALHRHQPQTGRQARQVLVVVAACIPARLPAPRCISCLRRAHTRARSVQCPLTCSKRATSTRETQCLRSERTSTSVLCSGVHAVCSARVNKLRHEPAHTRRQFRWRVNSRSSQWPRMVLEEEPPIDP